MGIVKMDFQNGCLIFFGGLKVPIIWDAAMINGDELITHFEPIVTALKNHYGEENVRDELFDFGNCYAVGICQKKEGRRDAIALAKCEIVNGKMRQFLNELSPEKVIRQFELNLTGRVDQ
jgi:hypothetical protein